MTKEGLPVRYRLVDRFGITRGFFYSASEAAAAANRIWEGEPQDPERSGRGWDIETVTP